MHIPPSLRKPYAIVKQHGFRRSKPHKKTFQQWIDKFIGRQKRAQKCDWNVELWRSSLSAVIDQLSVAKTCPIPLIPDAISSLTDYSKSPGVNLEGRREFATKGDVSIRQVIAAKRYLANGEVHKVPDFTVAFRRHLVSGDEPDKARIILVAPAEFVFVEKMFAEPLYNAVTSIPFAERRIATGFKWFSKHAAYMSGRFGPNSTSLDFSGFDLSPPHWMIRDVFAELRRCFDLTPEEDCILDAIGRVHQCHWVSFNKQRFRMRGGVKTGSAFTHLLGSIIGAAMMLYLTDGEGKAMSYGDDVVMEGKWNVKRLASRAYESSSFVIHPDKSRHGLDWLGNRWDKRNGKWVLIDPIRRLGQLFYPETTRHVDLEVQVQAHLFASAWDPISETLATALREMHSTSIRSGIRGVRYMLRKLDLTRSDPISAAERLKIWM
uniref:RdRp n=1 Tax=Beihai partiti-like virus 6 TaxID=1922508 RepID=A0A1L3KLK5_9VIRU|nr:RdRp [Beihai partiti-like virus 6]